MSKGGNRQVTLREGDTSWCCNRRILSTGGSSWPVDETMRNALANIGTSAWSLSVHSSTLNDSMRATAFQLLPREAPQTTGRGNHNSAAAPSLQLF